MSLPSLRRFTLVLALAALPAALLSAPQQASAAAAVPDPDRNSHALTGWGWHTNVSPAVVTAYVNQGNRIVDLELTSSAPKFSVAYVANSGTYARGWWWYYGKTGSKVKKLLKKHKARLIDIEPYSTGNGTRYAVVMVKNKGAAKKTWGWHYNVPLSTITDFVDDHDMRVIDVDRNPSGNRFSGIYIKNTGVDAKAWWHYYNVTKSQIKSKLKQKKARLIQLERISSTRYDVVMQKVAGGDYWWWLLNVSQTQLSRAADQFGARIFQVKSRVVNGKRRFDALLLNNVNAETTRIRQLVSDQMTGDWGFYLKKVDGGEVVGLGASNTFEPASMMKIVHAVTAMRDMQLTSTTPTTNITWYAHPDFPARYPGDPGYRENIGDDPQHADVCAYDGDTGALLTGATYSDDLGPVIVAQTLMQSDNRTTDALTRRYGFSGLNATKNLAGMTNSKVNHRIGCPGKASPQPLTHNALTLRDAGKIYEGVEDLTLLNSEHRNLLYTYMLGGVLGDGALKDMIIEEADDAGLSVTDRNRFLALVKTRSKGGSYGYCPNFDGSGTCDPPTVQSRTVGGLIWLPFKTGTGGTAVTPFVYGRYFNPKLDCTFAAVTNKTCTAYNKTAAGNAIVAVEMFRAVARQALATW